MTINLIKSQGYLLDSGPFSTVAKLWFNDKCALCNKDIEEGEYVFQHETTKNMTCKDCMKDLGKCLFANRNTY